MAQLSKIIRDVTTVVSQVHKAPELANGRPNISYYVDGLSTMSIYIRWMNWSVIDGEIVQNCPRFVIANVTVYEQGQGIFSYLLDSLKHECRMRQVGLEVECVLEARFADFLRCHNFVSDKDEMPVTLKWDSTPELEPLSLTGCDEIYREVDVTRMFDSIKERLGLRGKEVRVLFESTPSGRPVGLCGRKMSEIIVDEVAANMQAIGRTLRKPEPMFVDSPCEPWQEKRKRNAGFAKARRAAKKSRRSR
uniref:Uncharacterized protein n=1 Tax=Serratia phage Kevin TaxID=3161161 RepID=A0AAU8L0H5_9CAUD